LKKIKEIEIEIDELKNNITELINGYFLILSNENLRIFSKVK
jgi:hypothetical protein